VSLSEERLILARCFFCDGFAHEDYEAWHACGLAHGWRYSQAARRDFQLAEYALPAWMRTLSE
jgi:hypothetical protein